MNDLKTHHITKEDHYFPEVCKKCEYSGEKITNRYSLLCKKVGYTVFYAPPECEYLSEFIYQDSLLRLIKKETTPLKNKEICKKCWKKYYKSWDKYFDMLWDMGFSICFYRNDTLSITYEFRENDYIPNDCPFHLEHMILNNE